MFHGNAVLWKGMEKSGKNARIFPHLTHNTWKSQEKSLTFPHSHKTFSLRSWKCGKRLVLTKSEGLFFKPHLKVMPADSISFSHIPTISSYLFF
jgi:hypothetical protein